jgi:hypothetical protein
MLQPGCKSAATAYQDVAPPGLSSQNAISDFKLTQARRYSQTEATVKIPPCHPAIS